MTRSKNRALLLDYDGTLAPFRVERDKAVPYFGVRKILEKIIATGGCRGVVISGRSVEDLLPLLGLQIPPEIWGAHGKERFCADGAYKILPIEAKTEADLWIKPPEELLQFLSEWARACNIRRL
ncbi:MAG: hypothetical protein U9N58_01855 [Thermodesulfobacteriota bacterium]|nr:hypothetical protein [Thermodesulfobacteriota bacterium]